MRADQLMLQRGLAPTRSAAQRLIATGAVRWLASSGWALPRKAGEDLPEDCKLEVTDDSELRFVSRGGLKLDGALTHTGVKVEGRNCLDVGQSTGGFTDALLQRGAARVVGIDVGRAQLNPALAADGRVKSIEGLNARDISGSDFEREEEEHSFDLVVADLSFISMTHVLPTMARYLAAGGDFISLVKPQFELQPVDIGKGGLVKEEASYARVEQRIREACAEQKLTVRDYFASPIDGGDGNREFFVWAQPAAK
jgi:23S rRNA (cytidine1920-2'-O)/16S rRNA (cytidine1409-2'-O)-methyltransferase